MTEPIAPETHVSRELPIAQQGRRAVRARTVLEIVGVFVAAGFVMASAVSAKRSGMGPPLVAIDQTVALPAINATIESRLAPEPVGPVTDLLSGVSENDDTRTVEIFTPPEGHQRYFNGRPIRPARTLWMTVTGYSPDHRSCGDSADGYTSTNHSVWTNAMNLVAADPRVLPMRSMVSIPGYADDRVVPVLDVGGAIKGSRLDLLFPTHSVARQWGVKKLKVVVWEYADEPAGKKSSKRSKR